jgi:hypothetical protein
MANNPFYAFPEDTRAAFVQFDKKLENTWLNEPNDTWVNTPGLIYRKNMPYGASKARFTLPSGLFQFEDLAVRPTHFTHLSSLTADVDWKKWQEGVEDDHETIASDPNFNHWDMNEVAFSAARRRAHAKELASIFNSNPNGVWEGGTVPLFSTTHFVNLKDDALGSQANLTYSTGFSATNLGVGLTLFSQHVGMQGDETGLEPDTIIFPTALKETVRGVVDPQYLAAGTSSDNRYRGRFKMVWIPQLTDPLAWYLANTQNSATPPLLWAAGNNGNLQRIPFGTDSELFRTQQKVALSYLDRFKAYPGLYYNIHKFTSAAP